jgi:hypothetical protein
LLSTPIGLAYVEGVSAVMTPADGALESPAGTGHLDVFAEPASASRDLNEVVDSHTGIPARIFSTVSTTRFGAAHIDDILNARIGKRLQEQGRLVFSAAIDGAIYAKHGTTADTRLTVIDLGPAEDVASLRASVGIARDLPTLLDWITRHVPARRPIAGTPPAAPAMSSPPNSSNQRCLRRGDFPC